MNIPVIGVVGVAMLTSKTGTEVRSPQVTARSIASYKMGIYGHFTRQFICPPVQTPGFLQIREHPTGTSSIFTLHLSVDPDNDRLKDVIHILNLAGLPIIHRVVPKTTNLHLHTDMWCVPYLHYVEEKSDMYRMYVSIQHEEIQVAAPKTKVTRVHQIISEPLDRNLTRIYLENMDGYAVDDTVILENITTTKLDITKTFLVVDVNIPEGYININQRIQEDFSIAMEDIEPIDCSSATIYIDYYADEGDEAAIIALNTPEQSDVVLNGFLSVDKCKQKYHEDNIYSMKIVAQGICYLLMNPVDIALFMGGDTVYMHILNAVEHTRTFGPYNKNYNEIVYTPYPAHAHAFRSLCIGQFIADRSLIQGYRLALIHFYPYHSNHIIKN